MNCLSVIECFAAKFKSIIIKRKKSYACFIIFGGAQKYRGIAVFHGWKAPKASKRKHNNS